MRIHMDFETTCACPLKTHGLAVYAQDPTLRVWCLSYQIDDGPVMTWVPKGDHVDEDVVETVCAVRGSRRQWRVPLELVNAIEDGATVVAHNIPFELEMWNEVLPRLRPEFKWPTIDHEQTSCTMARAAAVSLPMDLAKLGHALGLDERKDKEGQALMLRMARPRAVAKDGSVTYWGSDPDKLAALVAYCEQDVRSEYAIDEVLPELTPQEARVWHLDYAINKRGVFIDVASAEAAKRAAADAIETVNVRMRETTGGMVKRVTNAKGLLEWVNARGVEAENLRAATVVDLLRGDIPADVRTALELRRDGGKTSVSKLDAMMRVAGVGQRARFLFQYAGAGPGRWAGRLLQLQNFPRPTIKAPKGYDGDEDEYAQSLVESAVNSFKQPAAAYVLDVFFGAPMGVISSCLRALIASPSVADPALTTRLCAYDFSNIEGRVLAWLAGEDWKIAEFKEVDETGGHDIYVRAYSRSFGVPLDEVTGAQRQLGKVQELALGYQGGLGSFASMGLNYGVYVVAPGENAPPDAKDVIAEDDAEKIKDAWRDVHPATVAFWYELERLAIEAVDSPGRAFFTENGRIGYKMQGRFLRCRLPSGRLIYYCAPRVSRRTIAPGKRKLLRAMDIDPALWGRFSAAFDVTRPPPDDFGISVDQWRAYMDEVAFEKRSLSCMHLDSATRKWKRRFVYGGLLAENVTQAAARDLLSDAMLSLDANGYRIVMHVHDEVVLELEPPVNVEEIKLLMCNASEWATGLPIVADGWVGERYRK